MASLVRLQRWWRRYLMKRYTKKAKELEAQQEALKKKMAVLQARIRSLDALDARKQRPQRGSASGSNASNSNLRQSAPSWKPSSNDIVMEEKSAVEKRTLSSQSRSQSQMQLPMQTLKLQSPITMLTDSPSQPTPTSSQQQQRYQEAMEAVEKSLVLLMKVVNTSFARKPNDPLPKHAPVVVPHQAQLSILRHLSETHSNLMVAMQIKESSEWTKLTKFDEPLPYSLGSLPWKRLMDDWAQGDAAKVGELTRWLAVALEPEIRDAIPPMEITCLQPVVLEGFLRLVVPTLLQNKSFVIQTKPLHATQLRIEYVSTKTAKEAVHATWA